MKSFLKKIATGALVAATLATPMLSAEANAATRRVVHQTTYEGPRGHDYRKTTVVRTDHRGWAKGQRFDRRYATHYRVINDPRAYRLYNAPRGYHWVRSGNDAVLVAITSGIIGAVIGNAIR
jgi:Ni/Co efflux regulator RcnB